MKTLVTINTSIPGIEEYCSYDSGRSLHDYDIVIFNPILPYYDRHTFSDGSSSIESTDGQRALTSLRHWKDEITNALKDGKIVFFLLASQKNDRYITGIASSTAKMTMYNSGNLSNYDVMPLRIGMANSKGSKIKVVDTRFRNLFVSLEGHIEYEVYLSGEYKSPIVTTISGGKALSAICQLESYPGRLVLLPYFNLDIDSLTDTDKKGGEIWTNEAMGIGTKLTKALKELDKILIQQSDRTPQPDWVDAVLRSDHIKMIEQEIKKINRGIVEQQRKKEKKGDDLDKALGPTALLYETGKPLEHALESFLIQLGYSVSNFQEGSLEIDHIIVSPEGKRLIGETEGKDNTAVSIDKFRQLETNINEDFQRDEVIEPASGLLFGNGYRLKEPSSRGTQFTDKCQINAKRLSVVLIPTAGLFPIAMYLQDNLDDEDYKKACRKVIESGIGGIVQFPSVPKKKAVQK